MANTQLTPIGNLRGRTDDTGALLVSTTVTVSAGPATIADGADVAEGTTTDAKATDSISAWSVVALLKGLYALLAGTLTVSGSLTVNPPAAGTSTLTNVPENLSSVTLLSSNAARLGGTIENDSDGILKVKAGTTASATSYTRTLLPREFHTVAELFGVNYTGRIDGIWLSTPATSGHASARVSEQTA